MDPTIWGPHAWIFLHTITLAYPESPSRVERVSMASFFNSLSSILPCRFCQKHYRSHLESYPVEKSLGSKSELVKWLISLHNQVNLSLGKPTMTVPQAIRNLNKDYGTPSNIGWRLFRTNSFGIYIILGVVSISLLVLWKWKFSRQKYLRNYK